MSLRRLSLVGVFVRPSLAIRMRQSGRAACPRHESEPPGARVPSLPRDPLRAERGDLSCGRGVGRRATLRRDRRRQPGGARVRRPAQLRPPDPPRDGEDGRDRYQIAADCFEEWHRTGALVVDDAARFYLYEMLFEDENGRFRRTHGVIGALELPPRGADPGAVGVLPHERTMKTAKSDRLSLLRATRANLDPIWVLSLTEGLSKLLVPHHLPLIAYCEDGEGVTHRLFPLTAPQDIAAVSEAVAAAPVVLADG